MRYALAFIATFLIACSAKAGLYDSTASEADFRLSRNFLNFLQTYAAVRSSDAAPASKPSTN